MVSIAPNQFRIEGVVVSRKKDEQLDGFFSVHIRLDSVEQLSGPQGFLDKDLTELSVNMADTLVKGLKKGSRIKCRIRKAPGRFFLLPDSLEVGEKD